MLNIIKRWASPLAIVLGVLFYRPFDRLSFLLPYMLFLMIFISYCSMPFREMRFNRMHFIMISVQIFLGIFIYFAVRPFSAPAAEAMMICIMAPTAIASTVVLSLISGNIAVLTVYTLLGNIIIALLLPVLLPLLGINADLSYLRSLFFILRQLFFMLILPLFLTIILSRFFSHVYRGIRKRVSISFYLYFITFTLLIGRSVTYFLDYDEGKPQDAIIIAGGSLIVCVFQYWLGRRIGGIYGEKITGGQAMGHKNTILAIWIAQSFLHPLSSIAPVAYILWQAVFNSYQVWMYQRRHPEV
ncbi:MAG: transporter [Deltaproteobacteria bacterium]|jgi:BASS family bile acid:Na+ symporter|nr:transporter [Deltaproteobacteria bacterium]